MAPTPCSKGMVLKFGRLLGGWFVFRSWWYRRVQLSSFNMVLPNQLTVLDDSFFENTEWQTRLISS